MSRSLHSSMEYLTSSNRWSRKDRLIEPEKSSIGEISSKISSRPERSGTSTLPASLASATRACHRSLPSSQSKLSVCRASRSGTSSGSRILANDRRPESVFAEERDWVAVREAAKDGSFHRHSKRAIRVAQPQPAAPRSTSPQARRHGLEVGHVRGKSARGFQHGQRWGGWIRAAQSNTIP